MGAGKGTKHAATSEANSIVFSSSRTADMSSSKIIRMSKPDEGNASAAAFALRDDEGELSLIDLSASASYALVMIVALRRSRAREEMVQWNGGVRRGLNTTHRRRRCCSSPNRAGGVYSPSRPRPRPRRRGAAMGGFHVPARARQYTHESRPAQSMLRQAMVTTLVGSLVDDFTFEIDVNCAVWESALNYVHRLIASFCLDEDVVDGPTGEGATGGKGVTTRQAHASTGAHVSYSSVSRQHMTSQRGHVPSRPSLKHISTAHLRRLRRMSQQQSGGLPDEDDKAKESDEDDDTDTNSEDEDDDDAEDENAKMHSMSHGWLAETARAHDAEELKADKSTGASASSAATNNVAASSPHRIELAAARRAKRRGSVHGGGGVGYTLSEVMQMNTPERTWTVINGFVYDITRFVRMHAGGMSNILEYCAGQDATEKFFEVHSNDAAAVQQLESMRIGVLISEEEK